MRWLTRTAGLAVVGADWKNSKLTLNDGETVRIGPSRISWVKAIDTENLQIPVYLDTTRADLIFHVGIPAGGIDTVEIILRSVGVIC